MTLLPFGAKKEKNAEKPVQQTSEKTAKKASGKVTMAHIILRAPHVTEKAGRAEGMQQYVFRVAPHAHKAQIAQAVFEAYGVKPIRVNTVTLPPKKRRRGAFSGMKSGVKKALVTLPQGKTIEVLPK